PATVLPRTHPIRPFRTPAFPVPHPPEPGRILLATYWPADSRSAFSAILAVAAFLWIGATPPPRPPRRALQANGIPHSGTGTLGQALFLLCRDERGQIDHPPASRAQLFRTRHAYAPVHRRAGRPRRRRDHRLAHRRQIGRASCRDSGER